MSTPARAAPVRHALLVHGAGGGGWEWNLWCAALSARGFHAHAPDLQPTAAGLAATGFDDYLQQVRAALDALPRPRTLIGASLGGLLALRCAEAADALVLVNPLPPAPWHTRRPPREWPARVPWRREARLDSTRRALPDADEATRLYAYRHWRDESGAVLRTAQAGVAVAAPACATLCVASSADRDVPPELTAELARAWNAELWRAPSPSHVGPLLGRGAAELAGRVADWLSAR
ncbi:alpha/beta hydrolase [Lysobacter sp. 5GHs7-4]|uniref:alpha/beta hydrolase n=1 Tax=Lysobacter sp. 5GHs7-4 TaxID=2904253 RepID=UPI001E36E0F2|nr:alpha/beta fold hydrolase [Lysobacter sp. 5GHs7-4]UHQ22281.1 alpha/beta hydrolase [Lysobacter sp. 5GHs7-4]